MIELCCEYLLLWCIGCEPIPNNYLNVKELLAQNRHDIWNLKDCNGTQTHNLLVRKRTHSHLAKLAKCLSCVGSIYLYGALTACFYHIRYAFIVNLRSVIWPVWLIFLVFVNELSECRFESRCSHLTLRYWTFLTKESLNIQAIADCKFTIDMFIINIKKEVEK